MRRTLWLIVLFISGYAGQASGQFVRIDEASRVSQNWIQMVVDRYGGWGTSKTAVAQPMQELRYRGRVIGYSCSVKPHGFIVVSLRRELAPVKLCSDENDLDFTNDQGMAGLIKKLLARNIRVIERRVGSIESASPSELAGVVEIDYRQSWNTIENYAAGTLKKRDPMLRNYQEGDILLTSRWHQFPPYNNDCPNLACDSTGNGRAVVGCVATGGGQILKYWNWPPYGVGSPYSDTYDWRHMPDNATTGSTAEEQAAVAELSHEFGLAAEMDYGCEGSSAYHDSMVIAFTSRFRILSSCATRYRSDYTASTWFQLIQGQLNLNRPLAYEIHDDSLDFHHSFVCDGWRDVGTPVVNQYHMNFGWEDISYNLWYTIDEVGILDYHSDGVLVNIVPSTRLGSALAGTYPRASFPYRYFDLDASGAAATFESGQLLQMLPGVTIKGTQSSTYVTFNGTPSLSTSIHTRADVFRGVIIWNGALRMKNGGTIKLH